MPQILLRKDIIKNCKNKLLSREVYIVVKIHFPPSVSAYTKLLEVVFNFFFHLQGKIIDFCRIMYFILV